MSSGKKNNTRNGVCLSDLTELMERMLSEFSKKVDSFIASTLTHINSFIESTLAHIRNEIASIYQHYMGKIKLLNEKVALLSTDDFQDRMAKRNELVMHGIPYVTGENLADTFTTICASLGYAARNRPIATLRRLTNSKVKSNSKLSGSILIEFAMHGQRNDFFARYLRGCSLTLRDLGLKSDKRIFINENLTTTASRILSAALKLKKDGKLKNVYTKDGIVCVVSFNCKHSTVSNANDLLHAAKST